MYAFLHTEQAQGNSWTPEGRLGVKPHFQITHESSWISLSTLHFVNSENILNSLYLLHLQGCLAKEESKFLSLTHFPLNVTESCSVLLPLVNVTAFCAAPTFPHPTFSNKAPKHCPKSTIWTEKHHEFQDLQSKPQNNSSRDKNIISVSLSQGRLCLLIPTPAKHFNIKLINSNTLTKSVPDKKLWLCQLWGHLPDWKALKLQEPFSVKIRKEERRGASQSHVTEAHPKPSKIQPAPKRAHEKESRILFLEWLFKLAHTADRKWRAYLFRGD